MRRRAQGQSGQPGQLEPGQRQSAAAVRCSSGSTGLGPGQRLGRQTQQREKTLWMFFGFFFFVV